MLRQGTNYLVTFVVMFGTTQNLGGLVGSALLGTIQTARARAHAEALAENLSLGDPAVVARLRQGGLAEALQGQANILAFNDTFWIVTLIALVTAGLLAIFALHLSTATRTPGTAR